MKQRPVWSIFKMLQSENDSKILFCAERIFFSNLCKYLLQSVNNINPGPNPVNKF